jgi:hypothetical protein
LSLPLGVLALSLAQNEWLVSVSFWEGQWAALAETPCENLTAAKTEFILAWVLCGNQTVEARRSRPLLDDLERIGLDGRLIVTGYETEAIAFTACVRETATEQARRGAVAVGPPARVLVKLYGCNGGPM